MNAVGKHVKFTIENANDFHETIVIMATGYPKRSFEVNNMACYSLNVAKETGNASPMLSNASSQRAEVSKSCSHQLEYSCAPQDVDNGPLKGKVEGGH